MLHEAVLLCQNLLEPGEAGEGILLRQLRLALNEWQGIVDEIVRHAVAFGVDPLLRHLLLGVCDLGERQQLRLAGVATVDRAALEGDHLIGDARDGVLHRGASGHDGLLDVGLAGEVRGAALEQGKLDAADLRAGLLLHDVSQTRGKAAELGVTIEYTEFNGQNDATTLNQIGSQVVSDGYDAVMPIATLAA